MRVTLVDLSTILIADKLISLELNASGRKCLADQLTCLEVTLGQVLMLAQIRLLFDIDQMT